VKVRTFAIRVCAFRIKRYLLPRVRFGDLGEIERSLRAGVNGSISVVYTYDM
jgi:hypothetical protein